MTNAFGFSSFLPDMPWVYFDIFLARKSLGRCHNVQLAVAMAGFCEVGYAVCHASMPPAHVKVLRRIIIHKGRQPSQEAAGDQLPGELPHTLSRYACITET